MPLVNKAQFTSARLNYLIIGGGTSGLALAARLSEDPNILVGVIEAGSHDVNIPEITVPGKMGHAIMNPKYDWTFFSVPQKHANSRVTFQPRGKGLGGSSLINFLGLVRPTKDEYNVLEELGNPGWNWESFLEYTKKSETLESILLSPEEGKNFAVIPEPEAHGTDGPVKKSLPTVYTDVHTMVFDTAQTLGIPRNPETSNGNPLGSLTSFVSIDQKTATRSHAANAYFDPNSDRENLLVLTSAQVLKVIFKPRSDGLVQAIGAVFIIDGIEYTVEGVQNDVILSAGTFQTPQILELSGIGNKDLLNKHGIETVIDLPGVGENLQDHVLVPTIVEIDGKYETMDVLLEPDEAKKHEGLYKQGQGVLSTCPSAAFIYFPATTYGTVGDIKKWQEQAEIYNATNLALCGQPELKRGLQKQYDIQKRWFADSNHAQSEIIYFTGHLAVPSARPISGKRYTTLINTLVHPLSRGSVHISSPDPLAPPAIDPNYFSNEADLNLLMNSLEFTLKFYSTPPFSDVVKDFVMPSPEILESTEPEERKARLREFIKDNCGPVFHPVGTSAMLPLSLGGVVDPELKVYGTANLRVVDLSIIPLQLACHTQSTAYAIAEKAADIIIGGLAGV